MDLSLSDGFLSRQRAAQWAPLITQQFRLRHISQITGLNFPSQGLYYFTLHATAMSAPFYTSVSMPGPNPKWPELDHRNVPHQGAIAMVIRIWSQELLQTWGIYFSGLVCLGTKPSDIQPCRFAPTTLVFNASGVFFTCAAHCYSETAPEGANADSGAIHRKVADSDALYRRVAMHVPKRELRDSCDVDKLRKLQHLQLTLKNRTLEVASLRERIANVDDVEGESVAKRTPVGSTSETNVRYAPKLLTMKSVNRMLEEKPTKLQRVEIGRLKKEIEKEQFTGKLLSGERDRMRAQLRKRKLQLKNLVDLNEETNSSLMSQYHQLSKEAEKLKELKASLAQNYDVFSALYKQLVHRRHQLLKELLFIYPIRQQSEKKWTIHGVYLPNSDILTDCSDGGVAVALGYITHVILMSATLMQIPLRYPMTHYGSRSFVTDQVTPLLSDRDRDFPLFTRGKERIHFTYAVYLLNKNVAHLRCAAHLNTPDLKSTLSNLASFLDPGDSVVVKEANFFLPLWSSVSSGLDVLETSVSSDSRRFDMGHRLKQCRIYHREGAAIGESGPGLSEILSIPEAFMNKQISREAFTSYAIQQKSQPVKHEEPIEQGQDMLDPNLDLKMLESKESAAILEQLMDQNGSSHDEQEVMVEKERGNDELRSESAPLTLRTDALLHTNSFNLVKPKSSL